MLSIPHLAIIFLVALVVLGPDKLPEVARTMGKFMAELRRVTGDFRYQVEGEMRELERQANMKKYAETEIGNYQPPAVIGSQEQTVDGATPLLQPPVDALPPEFTGDPLPERPAAPAAELPAAEPPAGESASPAQPAAAPEPWVDPAGPPAPAPAPVSVGDTVPRDKPGDPHPA
jgi:sec-independent protein translocase protein TatB